MLCMSRPSFPPHRIAVCGWRVDQLLAAVVRSGRAVRVDETIYPTLILRAGVRRSGRQRRGRGSCACSIALARSSQRDEAGCRQHPAPSHGPSGRKAIGHGTPFVSSLLHGSQSRSAGRVAHRPAGSCLIAPEVSGNRCRGAQVLAQPLLQLVALDKRQRDTERRANVERWRIGLRRERPLRQLPRLGSAVRSGRILGQRHR